MLVADWGGGTNLAVGISHPPEVEIIRQMTEV